MSNGEESIAILYRRLCHELVRSAGMERRQKIDEALVAGESLRSIAFRFDTSHMAVRRHKEHLSWKLVNAAELARNRQTRGLKLNHPEAVAVITADLLERIREGQSVAEVMQLGTQVLTRDDVMEGVPEMIPEIQIEGTFPDGTKLVTVHDPIR